MIVQTFIATLPSIINIGILMLLFLYIYSIIGMNLFPFIQLSEGGLDEKTNFV